LVHGVPYCFLDLLPFMVARTLLEQRYDLTRLLILRRAAPTRRWRERRLVSLRRRR